MSLKVGDVAFGRGGEPALVVGRDPIRGELTLNRDKAEVAKTHRHGYINGLKTEDRTEFLAVLDKVAEAGEPEEKLNLLKEKIAELEVDPRQYQLVGYLKSELFHVMHQYNITPREYTISDRP